MEQVKETNNEPIIKIVKSIKKYKNKNGEEKIKVYNQKNYNDLYYKNNLEKFREVFVCKFCEKNIIKSNKFNHEKTKTHILNEKYNINIKNL
jgi:nitrous oxidase accessory protein NosD